MKHPDPLEIGAEIANALCEAKIHVEDGFPGEAKEKMALAAYKTGELTAICHGLLTKRPIDVEKQHISKLQKKLNTASIIVRDLKGKNRYLELSNKALRQQNTDAQKVKDDTVIKRKITSAITRKRGQPEKYEIKD